MQIDRTVADNTGSGQGAFLVPFFHALHSSRYRYCVLHSAQGLPFYVESDLDTAIHGVSVPEFEKLLNAVAVQANWEILQRLWYDIPTCFYYVLRSISEPNSWLAVDILSDPDGMGRYGFSSTELTSDAVKHGIFYQSNPSVEFCYKLVKRIRKGSFKKEDTGILNGLFRQGDKDAIQRMLVRHYGKRGARVALHAFSADGGFMGRLPHMRTLSVIQLVKRRYGSPVRLFVRMKWQALRIYDRVMRPAGIILWVPQLPMDEMQTLHAALSAKIGHPFRKVRISRTSGLFERIISLATSTLLVCSTSKHESGIYVQGGYLARKFSGNVHSAQSCPEIVAELASVSSGVILNILRSRSRDRICS